MSDLAVSHLSARQPDVGAARRQRAERILLGQKVEKRSVAGNRVSFRFFRHAETVEYN
jgi:hypothetical protein